MKTKYPFLFILCLLCSAIIACSDHHHKKGMLEKKDTISGKKYYYPYKKTHKTITHNFNDSTCNEHIDSIAAENKGTNSRMFEILDNDSIKRPSEIIAQVPIKNYKVKDYNICTVGYKGVSIHYETPQSNLFPPDQRNRVDVTFEMSSKLNNIDLLYTSYHEVKRSDKYCMVIITVQYRLSNLLYSQIKATQLGLLFDGTANAKVFIYREDKAN